jgi:hypothetical protein
VVTHVWTTQRDGVVASHSRHSIASLTLASTGLGSLSIDAVTATAVAFHDGSGFHATTATRVGSITFTPPSGSPQSFPAPTPDQPVTIPGLATIYAGQHVTQHSADGSSGKAIALRAEVVPTGTSLRVAQSVAHLDAGLTGGVLRGHAAATHVVTAGGGIAQSGPNPLVVMPCQGTAGDTRHKALASLDLGGQLVVSGASSAEHGSQGDGRAWGFEKSRVAELDLGDGQLVVDGIIGKVHTARTPDGLQRSARGTQVGTVTASGQKQTFPPTGVLEIPGVARLERKVVTRTSTGIKVIALRVTLLDGSGAVVNLGESSMGVSRLPH